MTDELPPTIDILISEDVWGAALYPLAERWQVVHEPELWRDRDRFLVACARARALIVRNRSVVDAELLGNGEALRIVARAGVGLDNIDLRAADEAGIVVTAPLGANAISVAEHTIGLALALARGTLEHDRASRAGGWQRTPGTELHGGTWGLLGAGATARACGRLATALGMLVLAHDPYIDSGHPELNGIRLAPLREVLAQSDVVSCHLPATPETTGLIEASALARMREHALFVNVGRGEVVDEEALADALTAGTIGGAALDVRSVEPPAASRLTRLPNTVFTPHIAGITAQSQERILRVLATDVDAVLRGEHPAAAVGKAR